MKIHLFGFFHSKIAYQNSNALNDRAYLVGQSTLKGVIIIEYKRII